MSVAASPEKKPHRVAYCANSKFISVESAIQLRRRCYIIEKPYYFCRAINIIIKLTLKQNSFEFTWQLGCKTNYATATHAPVRSLPVIFTLAQKEPRAGGRTFAFPPNTQARIT